MRSLGAAGHTCFCKDTFKVKEGTDSLLVTPSSEKLSIFYRPTKTLNLPRILASLLEMP